MRGATCFSGIGAPEIAMPHVDWIWHSEIEPFPCAVMAHRHPNNQNLGDILAPDFIDRAKALGPLDIMVGGPPCQAFSIAGLRQSLADPRGNLSLRWVQVLHAIRPSIAVTENVPGWLSTADNAFGCFLAGIVGADAPLNSPLERGRWPNHGMVSGPLARAAWRVLDAQYVRTRSFPWAVPQRRRRVFVVISFGTSGIDPAAVLFDRESLRGNPAPRREAGQGTSVSAAPSLVSSGRGVERAGETRGQDPVVAVRMVAFGEYEDDGTASAMKARDYKDATDLVAHTLRGEGFDASEDGTGRGTPIVPVQHPPEIAGTLKACGGKSGLPNGAEECDRMVPVQHPIAIQERAVSENPDAGPDGKGWRDDGAAYTLEVRQVSQAVAFAQNTRDEVRLFNGDGSIAGALAAEPGMKQTTYVAQPVESAFTFNTTQLTSPQNGQDLGPDKPCHSLAAKDHPPAIAFKPGSSADARSIGAQEEVACTLEAGGGGNNRQAIAFQERGRADGTSVDHQEDVAYALLAPNGGGRAQERNIATEWGVRRLTPRECERLMGFPDDFTLIPWRGKDAENCPDGVRYKALGNSIAVNVISFIGERIEAVRAAELNGADE